MTSPGRIDAAPKAFSADGTSPVTRARTPRLRSAPIAAITTAAPVMSRFMVCIAALGLIEMPPVSNVMPLPTKTMVSRPRSPGARGVVEADEPRLVRRAVPDGEDAAEAVALEPAVVPDVDVEAAARRPRHEPTARAAPGPSRWTGSGRTSATATRHALARPPRSTIGERRLGNAGERDRRRACAWSARTCVRTGSRRGRRPRRTRPAGRRRRALRSPSRRSRQLRAARADGRRPLDGSRRRSRCQARPGRSTRNATRATSLAATISWRTTSPPRTRRVSPSSRANASTPTSSRACCRCGVDDIGAALAGVADRERRRRDAERAARPRRRATVRQRAREARSHGRQALRKHVGPRTVLMHLPGSCAVSLSTSGRHAAERLLRAPSPPRR